MRWELKERDGGVVASDERLPWPAMFGLGYAALRASGSDAGLAALLNSLTGPGAATIAINNVTRAMLLKGMAGSGTIAALAYWSAQAITTSSDSQINQLALI